MKKYRICKNDLGKYKVQIKDAFTFFGIAYFWTWCDMGERDKMVYQIFRTTYHDTKLEALAAIDKYIAADERREKKETWTCEGVV